MTPKKRAPQGADLWTGKHLPRLPRSSRFNEIAVFIAKKGGGKSTRALRDLERVKPSRTVLLWDPPGWFPRRIGGRPFAEVANPGEWLRSSTRGAAPYAVRFVGSPLETAHLLVAIAWALPGSLVVFDEAAALMPYGVAPAWLRVAITQARHRGVSLWFLSQSPTLLDKTVLRNADRAEIGTLGYDRDRETLAREFEAPAILKLATAKPGTFHTFKR